MKSKTKVYVGMDVHKDTVMIAVLPEGLREASLVKRLSHDRRGLKRLLDRRRAPGRSGARGFGTPDRCRRCRADPLRRPRPARRGRGRRGAPFRGGNPESSSTEPE